MQAVISFLFITIIHRKSIVYLLTFVYWLKMLRCAMYPQKVLGEHRYEYLLDRACNQFEPDDPDYIRVCTFSLSHLWINRSLQLLLLLLTFIDTRTQFHPNYSTKAVLDGFQLSNSFIYLYYLHHPWPNQAFSCQPSHNRSTSFYLSP